MSKDITNTLHGWEYDPDDLQVRIVAGLDGKEKLQMRIDLGLLQMEMDGRPDGQRPHGVESLLDYHEARVRKLAKKATSEADAHYQLDAAACAALMREGVQYYNRYFAAFHLQRYDIVIRDTERNLRLFAFVNKFAIRQRDKLQFDQYRPYVTMMRTRALGLTAINRDDFQGALEHIDDGVAKIRAFLAEYEQGDSEAECMELGVLLRWRRELDQARPKGPVERVEQQLALAVQLEEYEEAARLRDQLARLRGQDLPTRPNPS